jgi:hypothetical protein
MNMNRPALSDGAKAVEEPVDGVAVGVGLFSLRLFRLCAKFFPLFHPHGVFSSSLLLRFQQVENTRSAMIIEHAGAGAEIVSSPFERKPEECLSSARRGKVRGRTEIDRHISYAGNFEKAPVAVSPPSQRGSNRGEGRRWKRERRWDG